MERFARLLVFYKEYFTLLTAIALSVVLLFLNDNRQVDHLQKGLIDLTGTVQRQFAWVNKVFTALEENRTLRERNVKLVLENSLLHKFYVENQVLREKLGFKERQSYQLILATVISQGLDQFTKVLQIDVGERDGVKKNMPVITNDGLVGKILVVGSHCSLVQVLGDINFSVSAKVHRSQAAGILTWESGSTWEMENIVKSFDVQVGDTISTSGMSAVYPSNIPVGAVAYVSDNAPDMFKTIRIRSFVDFSYLNDVFVILNPPEAEFQLLEEHEQQKNKKKN